MIKNRSFMLGLGSGLIAGALLLQVMISGGAAPLSKEELVKQAAKLNLTVTDPGESDATVETEPPDSGHSQNPAGEDSDLDENTPAAASVSPSSSPVPAVQPSAAAIPSKPANPSQPAVKEEQAKEPSAPATPQAAAKSAITVVIPTGSTLTDAAELLFKAGVITDKSKFLELAMDRNANTRIQYGRYSFTDGESNNAIIDKLITVR